jgi:hypothetical protein
MPGFLAALGATHMHRGGLELHRRPLQAAEFGYPQAMPEADQDHGGVALAIAVAPGDLDQALDLMLGEVLAIAAHVPVGAPA